MKVQWHHQAFAGAIIALAFILLGWLLGGQGDHTLQIFNSDFGVAHIKSKSWVIWAGERFRFPFDLVVFFGAVIGAGIAVTSAWSHFNSRRAGD